MVAPSKISANVGGVVASDSGSNGRNDVADRLVVVVIEFGHLNVFADDLKDKTFQFFLRFWKKHPMRVDFTEFQVNIFQLGFDLFS